MLQRLIVLGALLLSSVGSFAQAAPSAYGGPPRLTVGGYFSYFDTNYAGNKMMGPGAFIDWTPPTAWRLGLEGEGRWLVMNGANNFSQYTYLVGPRYQFAKGDRLRPYAKVLVGAGEINFPYQLAHGSYFAIAPGGGVDYRLSSRIRLRADYEFQFWPNAVDIPDIQSSSLKPNGVSVGVSYRVF